MGFKLGGKLPKFNTPLSGVHDKLVVERTEWFYSRLGQYSAFSEDEINVRKAPYYKKHYKNGATVVPRSFYFVDIEDSPPYSGIVYANKTTLPEEKEPWKSFKRNGRVNSKYLYFTALAKNIAPFAAHNFHTIVLPIDVKDGKINLIDIDDLRALGDFETYEWFKDTQKYWLENRTEKNQKVTQLEYLNWKNKLVKQDLNKRYIAAYAASSSDVNAAVIDTHQFNGRFVLEHVTYGYYTDSKEEAYYLTGVFNSNTPNELIKDFQTKGLLGPRHVHRRILEVPFPKYIKSSDAHSSISGIAQEIERKILNDSDILSAGNIGKVRQVIRKQFASDFNRLDTLAKEVIR
jgi:hypothetical protein